MTGYLPRVADVPFRLGRPEDLPRVPAELGSAATEAHAALDLLATAARQSTGGRLVAARSALTRLGPLPDEPIVDDPPESQENRDNDLAFGIVRMHGDPVRLLVRAAVAAQVDLVDLAETIGVGLAERDWADLVGGLEYLLAWLRAPLAIPTVPTPPRPVAGRPPRPDDALRRWVRGHHAFMVLCQGMVAALGVVAASADDEATIVAATVVSRLLRASRGALRLAGDVRPQDYQAEIRPTLMPPTAPPKMSGLRWRDHEVLILRLRESAAGWSRLAETQPDLVVAARDALSETYQAHRGVCEHFVGTVAPSLLATARSTRSAGGVLEQLRNARLDLVPGVPPTGFPPTGFTEPS